MPLSTLQIVELFLTDKTAVVINEHCIDVPQRPTSCG